ncbi:MAG: laccase domain-containing protein [Thermotogae bacterium]|nr:laccase domain-containing protein [Thermotogota bacterium]
MWKRNRKGFYLELPFAEVGISTETVEFDLHLRQVHGARVVIYRGQREEIGDGVLTDRPHITLGVKTADCYPIFLLNERAVGVLHAGWRGSVKGILYEGLTLMHRTWGISPKEVMIAFGPGICGRCYEVGEDLKPYFGFHLKPKGNGKYLLDLYEYNLNLLRRWNVDYVIPPPACTYEDQNLFSHRRGDKGRLHAYVQLKEHL